MEQVQTASCLPNHDNTELWASGGPQACVTPELAQQDHNISRACLGDVLVGHQGMGRSGTRLTGGLSSRMLRAILHVIRLCAVQGSDDGPSFIGIATINTTTFSSVALFV